MSLTRGTVPKPSTLGLIGQLTESSQKSSLRNGLKRRTLRLLPVDVFAKMKISLFRPRGKICARNPEGRICEFSSPKKAASLLRTVFTREKRRCMVADHA
jgi:hypothetical protein